MDKLQEITSDMIEDVSMHLANNMDIAITFICTGEAEKELLYFKFNIAEIQPVFAPDDFLAVLMMFNKNKPILVKSKKIKRGDSILEYIKDDGSGKTRKPVIVFSAWLQGEGQPKYSPETTIAVKPLQM